MALSIKTHTWWINITVVNLMYAPQFHSTRFNLSNVHRALNSLITRHIVTHFTFPTSFNSIGWWIFIHSVSFVDYIQSEDIIGEGNTSLKPLYLMTTFFGYEHETRLSRECDPFETTHHPQMMSIIRQNLVTLVNVFSFSNHEWKNMGNDSGEIKNLKYVNALLERYVTSLCLLMAFA